MIILKNMKLGNSVFIFFLFFFFSFFLKAEDKIISTPLINLDKIKPSFEEIEKNSINQTSNEALKFKKKIFKENKKTSIKLIGLDKITAKTTEIIINLGEVKRFGPLEIKILKCGKIISENLNDNVAYLQVKDLSDNQQEKVFIFNGWTFASDPSLAPFDHAIYDLQLINCSTA